MGLYNTLVEESCGSKPLMGDMNCSLASKIFRREVVRVDLPYRILNLRTLKFSEHLELRYTLEFKRDKKIRRKKRKSKLYEKCIRASSLV